MMAVSLSVVSGQGYLNHNERKFSRKNIDRNRSDLNKQIYGESLENAYEKLFSNSIAEYNKNQKRADRKKTLEGYLQELENNKHKRGAEKPFYETIIQIGDKDTCGIIEHPQEAERAKLAILKYLDTWQERNPNLHVFNATLHMDEATPHMHIDYIPVATGYKQGIKVRNSLSKALENQGLGKGKGQFDNASIKWHEQERQALSEIAQEFGFEIEVKGDKRNRLTVAEYKAVADKLEKRLNDSLETDLHKTTFAGKVILSEKSFDKIEEIVESTEKLKEMNKVINEKLIEREREVEEQSKINGKITKSLRLRELTLEKREKYVETREAYCDKLEKSLKEEYKCALQDLEHRYELELVEKAIQMSQLLNIQREHDRRETKLKEREQALRIKEYEYELIKDYLPKAKELLEEERRQQKLELEQKEKEIQDLAKDREYLEQDIFIAHRKDTIEPQGSEFGLLNHGKQRVFTVYENGVAVDLDSHRYYISEIAKYDNESGKLSISGIEWNLSETSQKKAINAFESEEKRIENERYQLWYKVASESPITERAAEGRSHGFLYSNKDAFRIYENGIVVDAQNKAYNLTDFATINLKNNTISVVNATWTIRDQYKDLIEVAYKSEQSRLLNMAKKAEIATKKAFINKEGIKVSEFENNLLEVKKEALKEIKIEQEKKSTITFSRPKDNGRGGFSR